MERKWRKDGGRSLKEEKCGGNLWREIWRKECDDEGKNERKVFGFHTRLSLKSSIFTMIGEW